MGRHATMNKGDVVIFTGETDHYETKGNAYLILRVTVDRESGTRYFEILNDRGKAWLKKWKRKRAAGKDKEPLWLGSFSMCPESDFRPIEGDPPEIDAEDQALSLIFLKKCDLLND